MIGPMLSLFSRRRVGLTVAGAAFAFAGVVGARDDSTQCAASPVLTSLSLHGKKALVFGGTSGIGLATSRMLADEGASVIAISRDPSKAAEATTVSGAAGNISLAACDVRDRDAVEQLLAKHAPIDILISAATGGTRAFGPFVQMDMDGYQASFDKLWGYANVIRYGAPHLAADGSICVVSGAPARKPKQGQVALASVGAAVEQLVRAVAPEIAPRRINVVSPGIIDTPMFGPDGEGKAQKLAAATQTNLVPRPGAAEEVAQAILFVVMNRFVTGTTVDVDGGWLHGPRLSLIHI